MKQHFSIMELKAAQQLLWSDAAPTSLQFRNALGLLRSAVEAGQFEFAETIAETYAVYGPNHDAALAYKFYYVAYSADNFTVRFNNLSDDSDGYLGPVGDFRNEAMVSCMIDELGLAALPALDHSAATILAALL